MGVGIKATAYPEIAARWRKAVKNDPGELQIRSPASCTFQAIRPREIEGFVMRISSAYKKVGDDSSNSSSNNISSAMAKKRFCE